MILVSKKISRVEPEALLLITYVQIFTECLDHHTTAMLLSDGSEDQWLLQRCELCDWCWRSFVDPSVQRGRQDSSWELLRSRNDKNSGGSRSSYFPAALWHKLWGRSFHFVLLKRSCWRKVVDQQMFFYFCFIELMRRGVFMRSVLWMLNM